MIYIVLAVVGLLIGYYTRSVNDAIRAIEKFLSDFQKTTEEKKIERQSREQAKSTLIDPDDPIQSAKLEHLETMRRLNPQEDFDEDDLQ